MPFFDKLKGSIAKNYPSEKKVDYASASTSKQEKEDAPPIYAPADDAVPSYALTDPISEAAAAELNSAFSDLNISPISPPFPEPGHCLVHLKLLSAFHGLKEEVGFSDGLFGIQDSSSEKTEDRKEALAALREKRWSLYVARAAERFQEWWLKVLCTREDIVRMTTGAFGSPSSQSIKFPELGKAQVWTTAMLPPLGNGFLTLVTHT